MFDLQQFFGAGADHLTDAMTMLRSPLERPQNEHIQRPLEQFKTVPIGFGFQNAF